MSLRVFVSLLLFFNISACQREDAAFDTGPGEYTQVVCKPFQEKYRACYGPGWSEGVARTKAKYDLYTISIERVSASGSTVLFSKKFLATEVKPSVLNPGIPDLAQINGMTISFLIQEPPYVVDESKYMSQSQNL